MWVQVKCFCLYWNRSTSMPLMAGHSACWSEFTLWTLRLVGLTRPAPLLLVTVGTGQQAGTVPGRLFRPAADNHEFTM
jgi:hypothetical protein